MTSSRSVDIKSQNNKNSSKSDGPVIPESTFTNAFWHTDILSEVNMKNLSIIMTTPEDVVSVFHENWLNSCVKNDNKYRPNDLNLPINVPYIKIEKYNPILDPPLTNYGKCYAYTLSKVLRNQQIKFSRIFCGPELRNIQTALAVAQTFNKTVEIIPDLTDIKFNLKNLEFEFLENEFKLTLDDLKSCDFAYKICQIYSPAIKSKSSSPLITLSKKEIYLKKLIDLLTHLTSLQGPVMIISGPFILKLAESISELPDGFIDNDIEYYNIKNVEKINIEIMLKLNLNRTIPDGTMLAFERQSDDFFIRWPYLLPRMTINKNESVYNNIININMNNNNNSKITQDNHDFTQNQNNKNEPNIANSEIIL